MAIQNSTFNLSHVKVTGFEVELGQVYNGKWAKRIAQKKLPDTDIMLYNKAVFVESKCKVFYHNLDKPGQRYSLTAKAVLRKTGRWREVHFVEGTPFILKAALASEQNTANISELSLCEDVTLSGLIPQTFGRRLVREDEDTMFDIILAERAGDTMADYVLKHAPADPTEFAKFIAAEILDEAKQRSEHIINIII